MDWIKLEIDIILEKMEILSPSLFTLGAEGIEERNNKFIVYFKKSIWKKDSYEKVGNLIRKTFPEMEDVKISVDKILSEPWDEQWKVNFKPFNITENLIIYPDWEPVPSGQEKDVIIISPKMAFGTGHHETTQLIIEMIPVYLEKDMHVLDAGTGSGILAIYSVLKGAAQVMAYDFDPVATENAIENIHLNRVDDKIEVLTGDLRDIPQKKYDLILANININVLVNIPEALSRYIADDGTLILSGLNKTDFEQVVYGYDNRWNLIDQKTKNEWTALVFKLKKVVEQ